MTAAFQTWLDAQYELQQRAYGRDPKSLDGDERAEFIRWNVVALEDELHEALNEVGWKPWATSRHLNREAYVKELVDALHFLGNLLLVADVSGEELLAKYMEKRQVNFDRQAAGYDGVKTKCPNCKRDLNECGTYTRINRGNVFKWKRTHCKGCDWEVNTTPSGLAT